jgi:hypothetical protein
MFDCKQKPFIDGHVITECHVLFGGTLFYGFKSENEI